MAFFDKVGETISSKSKDMVKKAKDLAEISSLNGQINSQEETMNKAYVEIGQAYFELHKDIADDTYANQCNIIKDALAKIQQLKLDINKIKGVQICANCGAEIASGVAFCASCGTKVIETATEITGEIVDTTKKCPQCGASVNIDSAFCTSCGQKIE